MQQIPVSGLSRKHSYSCHPPFATPHSSAVQTFCGLQMPGGTKQTVLLEAKKLRLLTKGQQQTQHPMLKLMGQTLNCTIVALTSQPVPLSQGL